MHDELRHVRNLGLNTIRLEGKLETDEFFDLADRYGILVMAGWCCCDHWEHWDKWKPEDHEISKASLTSQIDRLRSHPSLLVWLNGSDNPPPPDVESDYIAVLKDRNTASYVIVRNYTDDIVFAQDDGAFPGSAYGLELPMKYFLDSFNAYR